jgi:hypothetical protein
MRRAAVKSLLATLTVLAGSSLALGQAGSIGGTIGKTDKSISGEEAAPRKIHSAKRSSAKTETRSPARRSGSGSDGGVARYDGTWTGVIGPGCPVAGIRALHVSGGRITSGGMAGTVDSAGSFRIVGDDGTVGTGRVSGNTASGSYRQTNGCSGTIRATRN